MEEYICVMASCSYYRAGMFILVSVIYDQLASKIIQDRKIQLIVSP